MKLLIFDNFCAVLMFFITIPNASIDFPGGSANIEGTADDAGRGGSKQAGARSDRAVRQLSENIDCYQAIRRNREDSVPQVHEIHEPAS